jgi:hypothetical protein
MCGSAGRKGIEWNKNDVLRQEHIPVRPCWNTTPACQQVPSAHRCDRNLKPFDKAERKDTKRLCILWAVLRFIELNRDEPRARVPQLSCWRGLALCSDNVRRAPTRTDQCMCSVRDVAPPLPHVLGVGLQNSVKTFETLHNLFSDMSLFIRTEMSSNFRSVWSVERVYQAISRKDRQTMNCQSVALGWTEYCDLMNGN